MVILNESLLLDAHPVLVYRFMRGCARFGGDVRVNSVLRDSNLQAEFFDCYQRFLATGRCPAGCERSGCASANRPGTSNHEPHGRLGKSLAIDAEPANGDWAGYWAAMEAEDLVFNIRDSAGRLTEAWHCQCRETPAPYYVPGSENAIPAAAIPPDDDPFDLGGRTALIFTGE